MDSVLAYRHHGWPTTSAAGRVREPMLAREGLRDRQGKNITPPMQALLQITRRA